MNNTWNFYSMLISFIGGLLAYYSTNYFFIGFVSTIVIFFICVHYNPKFRYQRFGYILLGMAAFLNRFVFKFAGKLGDIEFDVSNSQISSSDNVFCTTIFAALFCFVLDYFERNKDQQTLKGLFSFKNRSHESGRDTIVNEGNQGSIITAPDSSAENNIIVNDSTNTNIAVNYFDDNFKPRLITYRAWKHQDKIFSEPFFKNEKLDEFITLIKNKLLEENSSSIRVIGLSGLGKTRLIHECFNNFEEYENEIYYCNVHSLVDEVIIWLKRVFDENKRGCFIIDNCKLRLYDILREEISKYPQRFHLITIDKEARESHSFNRESLFVELTPSLFENDIINKIITHYYPQMPENDVEKIAQFAQGFPLIARLLADARSIGESNIGELTEDTILRKLIGVGENEDEDAYHVLRACSLFEKLGFSLELRKQKVFVANYSPISRLTVENKEELFDNKCIEFLKRGILEQQGRYITVRPKSLAIRLAADWWRDCSKRGDAFEIIKEISSNGLAQELCSQLSKLNFLKEAKELTEELCGPQSPFGNAEVLNTNEGSRIFRSLSEVNPQAATKTLFFHYGNADIDDLLELRAGRRFLVWTLEKLCFREDTFEKASKVLLNFAAAENENIGNNATGQFCQLFQLVLPGTSVGLDKRFKALKFALEHDDDKYVKIAFLAISRSFSSARSSSRMLGAEDFGSSPKLKDHYPTHDEIDIYYRRILNILTRQICEKGKYEIESKNLFGRNLNGIFANGFGEIASEFILKVNQCHPVFWKSAYVSLTSMYSYYLETSTPNQSNEIKELIRMLEPRNFKDKYHMIVKKPIGWDFYNEKHYLEENNEQSKYRKRISKNIHFFVLENVDQLEKLDLSFLFDGKQQQSIFFGAEVGRLLQKTDNNKYEIILGRLIDAFLEHPSENKDISVLAGYIEAQLDPLKKNKVLKELLDNEIGLHHFLNVARFCKPSYIRINEWFDFFRSKGNDLEAFGIFAYGRVLEHLKPLEILQICKKLAETKLKNSFVALDIISSYFSFEKENWSVALPVINEIISKKGFIKNLDNYGGYIMGFNIRHFILEEIKNGKKEFLVTIKEEIIDYLKETEKIEYHSEIEFLLKTLLKDHLEIVWEDLGQLILSNPFIALNAKFHLQSMGGSLYNEGSLFANSNNYDLLLDWCERNSPRGPKILASMMPTSESVKGIDQWHTFAKNIIDTFGSDQDLLLQIESNLGTFTSFGSKIPYLKSKLKLIELLHDHQNPIVRSWAIELSQDYKNRIKREEVKDQEWGA